MGIISGFGVPNAFLLEVTKGNVPGHELVNIVARNPTVGTAFEDLWGPSIPYVMPVASETWEIVSNDINDDVVGTGARTVRIEYLDFDYINREITVGMDGTAPVTLNSNHFRPIRMIIETAGSLKGNAGAITLRVLGGGDVRGEISITDVGFSVSQDGHFTIGAGKVGFGIQYTPFFPKNQNGKVRIVFENKGVRYIGGEVPFYQSGVPIEVAAPFNLPEKTDISFQANARNGSVSITLTSAVLVINESEVNKIESTITI